MRARVSVPSLIACFSAALASCTICALYGPMTMSDPAMIARTIACDD